MSVRLGEDDRLCLLVVIGVREDGVKALLASRTGLPRIDGRLVGRVPRPPQPRDDRPETRQAAALCLMRANSSRSAAKISATVSASTASAR
jgi:hypothetical protein